METLERIRAELGYVPSVFDIFGGRPRLLERFYAQMRAAYFDTSLPQGFVLRLGARLGRYAPVPYCLKFHCAALCERGIPPSEIAELVLRPRPSPAAELEHHLKVMQAADSIGTDWPAPTTALGDAILRGCEAMFLLSSGEYIAEQLGSELRRLLGDTGYADWMALMLHIRSLHGWLQAYPDVSADDEALVREHMATLCAASDELAAFLVGHRRIVAEEQKGRRLADAEARLQYSEELRQRVMEAMPGGIVHVGSDGSIQSANAKALELLGLSYDALMARYIQDFETQTIWEDGTPCSAQDYPVARALVTGEPQPPATIGVRRPDGTTSWAIFTAIPVKDPTTGGTSGVVVTFVDVTPRIAAETALLESQSKLGEAAENLEQTVERLTVLNEVGRATSSSLDLEDSFRALTRATKRLIGFDRAAMSLLALGPAAEHMTIVAVEPPDSQPPAGTRVSVTGALAELVGDPRSIQTRDIRALDHGYTDDLGAQGYRSMAAAPLRSRDRTFGFITLLRREGRFTDGEVEMLQAIADQIAPAVENARLHEQVQQSAEVLQRRVAERTEELEKSNEELKSFAYSVSHDLRAPLRGMDGFAKALLEDYAPALDERGRDYLARIHTASRRMAQLIDDILSLSRVTSASMTIGRVDLSTMAHVVVDQLREAEPEREVEVVVAPGLSCRGDAKLLRVALSNLLGNAWKFTKRCDTARIEVGRDTGDDERVFYVRDNGVGFDPRFADKLFGVFQRLHADSEFEGTGIGLATVERIVHRHGGHVWAEGQPGRGATFYFSL